MPDNKKKASIVDIRLFRRGVLAVLVLITPLVVLLMPQQAKIARLQQNEATLNADVIRLTRDLHHLALEKEVLENKDPYYFERLARKSLKMKDAEIRVAHPSASDR